MRAFLIFLIILLACLAGVAGVLLIKGVHINERLVFMPPPHAPRADLTLRNEAALSADVRHERAALGGQSIALTYVGDDDWPLIVSCFGNASDRISLGVNTAQKMGPFGQVLLWDYPGYGDSSGEASVAALNPVLDDLAPLITAQGAGRPIILWGHSLGGFVCSQLATRLPRIDAIILETTAPSIDAVAKAWTPKGLPIRVSYDEGLQRFNIPDALAGYQGPILIFGGGRDQVLPVHLARSLTEQLVPRSPQLIYLELPEATHYSAGYDPRAQEAVRSLMGRIQAR